MPGSRSLWPLQLRQYYLERKYVNHESLIDRIFLCSPHADGLEDAAYQSSWSAGRAELQGGFFRYVRHPHVELAQKIHDCASDGGLRRSGQLTESVSRIPLYCLADADTHRTPTVDEVRYRPPRSGGRLAVRTRACPVSGPGGGDGTPQRDPPDVSADRIGDAPTGAALRRRFNFSRTAVQNALIRLAQ